MKLLADILAYKCFMWIDGPCIPCWADQDKLLSGQKGFSESLACTTWLLYRTELDLTKWSLSVFVIVYGIVAFFYLSVVAFEKPVLMQLSSVRSNSYSYLAFNPITRYQSVQDLLHVTLSNCIYLECDILSSPISSTFKHALASETRRARAVAGCTLHSDCVIIVSNPKA